MKVLKIMIVMLVLILSAGVVSAADNVSDESISYDGQDTLEVTQDDIYTDGESSFTNLIDEIKNAGNVLNLTKDYSFNNETDKKTGILIVKDNFTLNGNGHTIDGNKESRIFNITGNNVILNNLILINANADKGGAIFSENNITCNNLTFKNNNALTEGGAIYVSKLINLTDCNFDSNYALKGADLYFKVRKAPEYPNTSPCSYIENTTFKNAKNIPQASAYMDTYTNTTFKNCLFENITGEYGSAIYYNDNSYCNIVNSRFENLYANKSGGAIALICGIDAIIKNSTFINCKSSKNGGAIYADENSWTAANLAASYIHESDFINCSSDFGGAIAHVGGGSLNVYGCNFTQNSATYLGGAVYGSYIMNINFANSTFNNNKLSYSSEDGFFGDAIYSLFSRLKIDNSTFVNNSNNSIYCYGIGFGGKINITNSYFENNVEAIRAVHVESFTSGNNTFIADKIKQLDDDEFLRLIMSGPAIELELLNNTINVTTLPARFDSRDWGWVSPVKNQGFSGGCWCFATCAALESALLKATGIEYDISEQNMQKMLLAYSKYGNDKMVEPGQPDIAIQYALSWLGIIPEKYDTFDMIGKITKDYVTPENIHIQDVVLLYGNKTNMSDYKKAIMDYGAVTSDIVIDYQAPYFNANTSAAYYNKSDGTVNHSITIVGWDDNYSKENFLITPPGNGAWIVKNSYGAEEYDNGYIYVSYYDTSIANTTNGLAFSIENTEKYTKNYQTDFGGEVTYLTGNISYKNTYNAVSSDLISAIGTYFHDMGEEYSFDVYVNDVLKLKQNGSVTFAGFHTIKLENEIPIKTGDNFTVIMTKNSLPLLNLSKIYYKANTSLYNKGSGWIDTSLENQTAILKVYTKDLAIYTEDLVKIYKNASKFEADIGVANKTVTFEINGGRYTRVSDENGTTKMAINLEPGNYTIKTIYNNASVENTITVLPTLIAENLIKYFRNASQFYISLIDGEGNSIAGKSITMNINGVFYNRLTNENGTAKLNINLEPGEYILTATDPLTGLKMSYIITVLPTLIADDLEMKYKDGSTFNVTVLNGQGKALANVKVTFNVNGVFYNRISDSHGIAKLNINLMAGKYIITSEYDGLKISNTITIKD